MPHTTSDWLLLFALTVLWGSSFAFTQVAVEALPVQLVVAARLLIACALLLPAALLLARRPAHSPRLWAVYGLIALFGSALPYSLVTWGQQTVASAQAGILMAAMPLATLGMAHYLVPGERMNRHRAGGFLIGFCGVAVLLGPAIWREVDPQQLPAMAAILLAACCYAITSILARLRPPSDALYSAAATTTLATLMLLPALLALPADPTATLPTGRHLLALFALGAGSTALAAILYMHLVKRTGAAFVSQLNYLIPLWALGVGVGLLGEPLAPRHLIALALILGGMAVVRREHQPPTKIRVVQSSSDSNRSAKARAKRR
ncbi:DMT family transporter [Marichromatium bheemlicum]|uniref:DMT family transporter n=1 Tax=Marichromatium bheemlicum TaxID=365339 RepID=A0ABX1IB83_9GAMM|nr:DMT family transporter [Marichromatium bheemlicum]NKN34151.1 DMT family transporter [Marichromatium bheemlicum]